MPINETLTMEVLMGQADLKTLNNLIFTFPPIFYSLLALLAIGWTTAFIVGAFIFSKKNKGKSFTNLFIILTLMTGAIIIAYFLLIVNGKLQEVIVNMLRS